MLVAAFHFAAIQRAPSTVPANLMRIAENISSQRAFRILAIAPLIAAQRLA
jgi:hypothetical protein